MKQQISDVYRWRNKNQRYVLFTLAPLVIFNGVVWAEAMLDGPSGFTVIGGLVGFLLVLGCLGDIYKAFERLPNFTNGLLKANHGATLEEVMAGIRNEPVKFMAAFDEDGEKLFECTELNPYAVARADWVEYKLSSALDVTVVYNHPIVNRDGLSRTFNMDELEIIAQDNITTAIVVSPDMTYTLTIPIKRTGSKYQNRIWRTYRKSARKAKWFFAPGRGGKQLHSIKVVEYLAERMNWDFSYEAFREEIQ